MTAAGNAITLTSGQYASLAVTATSAVTLNDIAVLAAQVNSPVLALGNFANVIDASATANFNLTGGTAIDTFNFGAQLTAADTVAGGTGIDILTVTGAAAGSGNITAVETIQVNYAAAATFTTGAMAPGVASTINLSGSTAAVTLDALLYVPNTSLTITDGAGGDTISVPVTDALRLLTTVSLATGGSDTVSLRNEAHSANSNSALTINNFVSGVAAGADKLVLVNNAATVTSYLTVTAAATNVTGAAVKVIEIETTTGVTLTDFTATGANGAVETAIASALGTTATDGVYFVVVYGSGAQLGNAAVYSVESATNFTAGQTTVELLGVLNGVAANSLVTSNFI